MPQGVTELVLRPATDTAELRAVMPDWPARVQDHDIATASEELRALAARADVSLASYRSLRALQRGSSVGSL
jgi:hypothetical protein